MYTPSFTVCKLSVFMALSAMSCAYGQATTKPTTLREDCTHAGCHDSRTKHKVLHAPVDAGECTSCHELVSAETHTYKFVAEGKALCEECHEDVTEEHKFAHGAAAGGGCVTCHDPHGSDQEKMLVRSGPDLCLRCHTAVAQCLADSAHKHSPATEDCLGCHSPHGAENTAMLTNDRPGLCFDCHDDLAALAVASGVKHGAVACNRSCTYCHQPHGSNLEHILRKQPSELCLSCHDREIDSPHGKVPNIAKMLSENAFPHGPIKDKKCAPCHAHVHGGSAFRLLCREYPSDFYTSFDASAYALCFGCHEEKAMEEEHTKTLTKFRNGNCNLHYVHVNRDQKGRSCRACHNSHASDNPKHMTKSVTFGKLGWSLPLNCNLSDTGGSCAPGCHKPYAYDRKQAIVNVPAKTPS